MERYKDMAGSKGKMFTLQHYYKLLEHSEKLNIRDRESTTDKRGIDRIG
jgi:hypothetical protein